MLEVIEEIVDTVEDAVSTFRRRHIVGGILLSVSLLFAGLAITAITLKKEENEDEDPFEG